MTGCEISKILLHIISAPEKEERQTRDHFETIIDGTVEVGAKNPNTDFSNDISIAKSVHIANEKVK